jgi:hypothetical protein
MKIDGELKIKNMYVAILGLLVMIGVLICIIILTLDIFNKRTMNIIQNTVSNKLNNITLDTSNPISIIVTNNLGMEYNEADRIYDIQARYVTYIPSNIQNPMENLKIKEINSTKCQYKKLEGDQELLYGNVFKMFNSIKCFDLKPYNMHIFGDENPGLPQGILQFFLNKCTNTTTKNNCLPQNEIDKKLSSVKMSFIFPNKDIDNLLTNPIINFTDGIILRFASSIDTKYFLEFDELNFSLDEGLFFESMNYKKSYKIEKMSVFQDNNVGGDLFPGSFGLVVLKCSGKQINYKRTYKKFESLFPLFYTIYYFTVLFFKILVKFLLKGNLEELLFYKIFDNDTFSKIKNLNNKLRYEDLFFKNTINNSSIFMMRKKKNNNKNENENDNNNNNNDYDNYNDNNKDNSFNKLKNNLIGENDNINNNIDNYFYDCNNRLNLNKINSKENQHINLNSNLNLNKFENKIQRKNKSNRINDLKRSKSNLENEIEKRNISNNNNENVNEIQNNSRAIIIKNKINISNVNENNFENEEINKEKDENLQK